MSRSWWMRWTRMGDALTPTAPPGTSFAWPDVPRDTDLTREQIEIAMRESAASPSQPDAGRTVETTAPNAPRPQEITAQLPTGQRITFTAYDGVMAYDVYHDGQVTTLAPDGAIVASRPQSDTADWIERAQPGSTPVLGGIVGTQDADGSSVVWSDGSAMYGHGETPGAAMRDYAESRANLPAVEGGRWPSMPMRELSNDNYDRVWVAQGDHVEAMGVGDTPQEAAIEYARAVADLLRPVGGPDAFDSKAQIREQQRACRSDCGDGPCGCAWEEWSR